MKTIGIVGCGAVTRSYYQKFLPLLSEARVVAVSDLNPKAAAEAAKGFGARTASLSEIADCDLCIIATPPASHFGIAMDCLGGRASVAIEKPFVGTLKEGKLLVKKFAERNRDLYVAHLRRFFPAVRKARELICSGALGRVKEVSIYEGGRFAWGSVTDYTERDPLGGVLFDTGSHAVDMALFMCGLDATDAFAITLLSKEASSAEPSHQLRAEAELIGKQGRVGLELVLSRHGVLANRVLVRTESSEVIVSTMLRDSFTVRGPNGYTRVRCERIADPLACFLSEYKAICSAAAPELHADRFLNLTATLEALAA